MSARSTWCAWNRRSVRRRAEHEAGAIDVVPIIPTRWAAAVARTAEQAAGQAALAARPAKQRAGDDLMIFKGVSLTGVAEQSGIPRSARVKSRSRLAMRKLRGAMETER